MQFSRYVLPLPGAPYIKNPNPFLFTSLNMHQQFIISASLAGMMFFSIGMLKSLVFSMPVFKSGLRTLLTGSMAASLAYVTGYFLRAVYDIS